MVCINTFIDDLWSNARWQFAAVKKKTLKQFQGWNILYFLLHRFPSQPPFSYDQEHSSSCYFFFPFSFSLLSYLNSMVKHYKAFDSYYCCVTVTLFWQIQKSFSCQMLAKSYLFSLSLILVLRQEHSSGVEGSQPARGNLCCMGKTPWGSLHICSVVAQGQDRAN